MQFLALLFLSIPLDAIEIILTLIDVGTIIGIVIHLFQIILDLIFNLLLIAFGLLSAFKKEIGLTRLILRRLLPILISVVGETIPVIDALPLRTITLIFLWLETSGILDNIISKIGGFVSSALSVLPAPLRERVESLAKRHPVGSMLLSLKEKTEGKGKAKEPQIISEAQKKKKEIEENEEYPSLFQRVAPSLIKKIKEPTIVNKARQLRKIISILILFVFFPFFALAQDIDAYLFSKKTTDGIIISAIFVDKKTKSVYSFPYPSVFEWNVPFSQIPEVISYKPFFKINLQKNYSGGDFKIKFSIKDAVRSKKFFSSEKNIYLEEPDVSIIYLKKNYFEIPFVGNPLEKEIITFKTFGFSSNNLSSLWKLNGIFISNEKFLNPHLLSSGFLSLEVRNLNNSSEVVIENAFLR